MENIKICKFCAINSIKIDLSIKKYNLKDSSICDTFIFIDKFLNSSKNVATEMSSINNKKKIKF